MNDLAPPAGAERLVTIAKFAAVAKFRFPLARFDDITVGSKLAYLVKGLIPRTGLIVIYGPPKCGKSFWTSDLALHVALGWEYRGRRVQQGHVVYCAFEGVEGFRARIEAFRRARLADRREPVPFYLMSTPLDLIRDHAVLITCIRDQLDPELPVMVVLDTLNRSLVGKEDDQNMPAYVRAADAIRDEFKCAVAIVHHSGIDSSRPRGHTSLTGAADAQISVKRDSANNIIVTLEWMKDGPEGNMLTSKLDVAEVGRDEDGDPITSCVVTAVEGAADRIPAVKGPKLPKAAQIALRALHEALAECGKVPPASNHIPQSTQTVMLAQWRDYAFRIGITHKDNDDARRMAFKRAFDDLLLHNRIGTWDEQIWLGQ